MMYSILKAKTVHYYLAVAFVFLVPFFLDSAKVVAGLMLLNWLLSGTFIKNYKKLLRPIPLLFIGFYIINLIGLIYSEDLREGLAKVETKLLLVIFPLILFSFDVFTEREKKTILYSFIFGVFTASLIFFFHALAFHPSISVTFEKSVHWTHIMGYHRAYTALQMAMSFFIVLYFFVKENKSKATSGKKIAMIMYMVYSFIYVFLLSSRMEIIAISLVFVVAVLFYFILRGEILKGIGSVAIVLLVISMAMLSVSGARQRFGHTITSIFTPKTTKEKQTAGDIRPIIWALAVEIIQENPIIGVGTGDVQSALNDKYIENGEAVALKHNLTVHNEFIQTMVSLGIFGFLLLLGITLYPFLLAIKKQQYLYLFFLALFILANMTESMLEKQEGVMYFAFFNSFFAVMLCKK